MNGRPLIKKLAEVMGAVGYVPKTGKNQEQGYSYAREADIVHMIRGELSERGIMVIPDVQGVESIPRTLKDGKSGNPITRVKILWHLIDAESGDSLSVTAYGDGMDSGDKGLYKALTGCQKYLWMKMLHLPTGDDPENDQNARGAPKSKASAPRAVSPVDGPKRGAWAVLKQLSLMTNEAGQPLIDPACLSHGEGGDWARSGLWIGFFGEGRKFDHDSAQDWRDFWNALAKLRDSHTGKKEAESLL